jgi:glycosyltransferase involved in cell wall biosynthesis
MAAAEAAASGIPIVTTRVNGIEDYNEDGSTGFIIPDVSTEAIANAAVAVVTLPPAAREAMGRAAQRAMEKYERSLFFERFDQIYSTCLSSVAGLRLPNDATVPSS